MTRLAFGLLATLLTGTAHAADTIYMNNTGTGTRASWESASLDTGPGVLTYDDFTLSANGASAYSVSGATWSGYYYDNTTNQFLSGTAGTQTFILSVYGSKNGKPDFSGAGLDNALFSRFLSATPTGYSSLNYNVNFAPFQLDAGKQYWLDIYAVAPIKGDNWSWNARETPLGNSVQYDSDARQLSPLFSEQVFSLKGSVSARAVSAAPEPGAWLLMIVGAGLAGGVLRRGRNTALRLSAA